MKRILAALAALLFVPLLALAQTGGGYRAAGETRLVAISTSASTPEQLTPFASDANCNQITISNNGSTDFWVEVAATSGAAVPDIPIAGNPGTSTLVKAGTSVDLATVNRPFFSAKTAASTSTLTAACSTGSSRGVTTAAAGAGGTTTVQGTEASDAPVSGNPLLTGARASAVAPTAVSADGDAVAMWANRYGAITATTGLSVAGSDAVGNINGQRSIAYDTNPTSGNQMEFRPYVYNGSTWDRLRGNTTGAYVGAPTTGGDPCGSTSTTKSSVSVTATADTELVALTSTQIVYVCGFTLNAAAGTTPGFRLIYGTGAVCATGTVGLTGIFLPTLSSTITYGGGGSSVMQNIASNALCIDVSGTTPDIRGVLTYVKQ